MLLVQFDHTERARLTSLLEDAGLPVHSAASMADVERWPAGEIVITSADRFTPWWKQVGATHVLVIARSAEEGQAACDRGAATWMPESCPPEQLVAAVRACLNGTHPR